MSDDRKDKFNWDDKDIDVIYPDDPNYEKELHTDSNDDDGDEDNRE